MTSTNRLRIRNLKQRLAAQRAELKTCTTDAMRKCVQEAINDTYRQLAENLSPDEFVKATLC